MLLALLAGFWLPAGLAAIFFTGAAGLLLNLAGVLLLGLLAGVPRGSLATVAGLVLAAALLAQQTRAAKGETIRGVAYAGLVAVLAALVARPTAGILTLAGTGALGVLSRPRRQVMRELYLMGFLLLSGLAAHFWLWRHIFF